MKTLVVLTALFVGLFLAVPVNAGELSLQGEGKVSAKPDMGYISVAVVTEAPTAAEAVAANTVSMNKLYAVIDEQKIPRSDIQTSDFSVQPKYAYEQNKEPKFLGYVASNQVTVKICFLHKMGGTLDALVKEGANRVGGVSFGVKDSKELLDKARVLAMQDALSKSKLYAEAGAFTVGKFKHVSESVGGGGRVRYMAASARAESAPGGDVPVSGGELTFQVNVSVTWEIE